MLSHSFGLFEGMSAIEMMDPKMDAGMMCNQTKRKVLNLQQSIEVRPSTVFVIGVLFVFLDSYKTVLVKGHLVSWPKVV